MGFMSISFVILPVKNFLCFVYLFWFLKVYLNLHAWVWSPFLSLSVPKYGVFCKYLSHNTWPCFHGCFGWVINVSSCLFIGILVIIFWRVIMCVLIFSSVIPSWTMEGFVCQVVTWDPFCSGDFWKFFSQNISLACIVGRILVLIL